jgi:fatty acid-binding protein DegV
LKFAARSGRVPNIAQYERELNNRVPVLRNTDGTLHVLFIEENTGQAIERLKSELANRVRGDNVHVAIAHAGNPAQAEALRAWAQSVWSPIALHLLDIPPIIAVYSGSGALAVAAYNADS